MLVLVPSFRKLSIYITLVISTVIHFIVKVNVGVYLSEGKRLNMCIDEMKILLLLRNEKLLLIELWSSLLEKQKEQKDEIE